jgi:hypothetical protein
MALTTYKSSKLSEYDLVRKVKVAVGVQPSGRLAATRKWVVEVDSGAFYGPGFTYASIFPAFCNTQEYLNNQYSIMYPHQFHRAAI